MKANSYWLRIVRTMRNIDSKIEAFIVKELKRKYTEAENYLKERRQ